MQVKLIGSTLCFFPLLLGDLWSVQATMAEPSTPLQPGGGSKAIGRVGDIADGGVGK